MSVGAIEELPRFEDSLLSARNVESGYGDLQVLEDITLDVQEDEIVLIFGPNGAGKSTFLRAAYRLIPVWDGSIDLSGQDITELDTEEMIRNGVCYVPQRENIFSNLTVDENLQMGALYVDNPDEQREDMYDRFPTLDQYRDSNAGNLSGGEQQRVALALALMVNPDLILIDEPSAGLAPQAVENIMGIIEELKESGVSILMVEQNVRAGVEIADRGYVLANGETRYEGPAEELIEDPKIQDLYV